MANSPQLGINQVSIVLRLPDKATLEKFLLEEIESNSEKNK